MNTKLLLAASLSCLSLASYAKTADLAGCSFNDLSGVTVTKCAGYFAGNLINNSPGDVSTVEGILQTIFGVSTATGAWVEKLDNLNNSKTINFTTPLSGNAIVALHFGGGVGSPGNGTAFYEFNAGLNLDSFKTIFNASSNAAIYRTTPVPVPVPEPETYAMLLGGIGLMGTIVRRRKNRRA